MPPERASLVQLVTTHHRQGEVVIGLRDAARRLTGGRGGDDALAVVRDAVAYLGRAVPRHFADEEKSLFPRLVALRPDLREEIDRIVAEHPVHLALHERIAAVVAGWDGEPRPADAMPLLELAEELERLHGAHVAAEQVVFAAAAEVVGDEDDRAIASEMESRRGGGGGGGGGGGRRRG